MTNLEGFSKGGRSAVSIIASAAGVIGATLVVLGALGMLRTADAKAPAATIEQKVGQLAEDVAAMKTDIKWIRRELHDRGARP